MTERRPGTPPLEDAIWIALLERYVRGETAAALALEYGVSIWAVAWQARNRGYRKMDRPDAVYRWRQPPPIAAHETRAENLAFDFDPADPEGSAARALELARRAANEGRIEDHLRLNEAARSALRTGRAMRLGLLSPSPAGGGWTRSGRVGAAEDPGIGALPAPSLRRSDDPPPEGEGEGCGASLVLRESQRPPLYLENGGRGRCGCFWAGAGRARPWPGRRGYRTWPSGAGGWPWSGDPA